MQKNPVQNVALSVTRWIGSPTSLIIHSFLFIGAFLAVNAGFVEFDKMLLVLTTLVSLEAIYLSILIQMTINYTTQSIEEVGEDIEVLQGDIGEIQEDVGELQEDVEEISEDVEEMAEEEAADEAEDDTSERALAAIQSDLQKLLADVERLKNTGQK